MREEHELAGSFWIRLIIHEHYPGNPISIEYIPHLHRRFCIFTAPFIQHFPNEKNFEEDPSWSCNTDVEAGLLFHRRQV